jgi:predicted AlkP superfamily phosphohydrolase/phosphomutase
MIGGVAIPPGASFIHPESWATELARRAPFPTNGMEWTRFDHDPRQLVEEAARLVGQRSDSFEVLLEGPWTVATCVFVAPDRLQHPLGAHVLPSHPNHPRLRETGLAEAIRGVFRLLDRQLGRLRDLAGADATVILLSDHGFRPINRTANLDRVLASLGLSSPTRTGQLARSLRRSNRVRRLLKTRVGRVVRSGTPRPQAFDWSRTRVYQSGSAGQLSINLRGREAQGVVDPSEHQRVCFEAREALLEFRDPETGERPVGEVLLAREIYRGQYAERAADLIVLPSELWTFGHAEALTGWTDWPTGSHRRAGIIAASGPGIAPGFLEERDIADLAPTVLALVGASYDGFDGSEITVLTGRRETTAAVHDGGSTDRADVSEDQQEAIAQHLRDLGYIE